MKEEQNRPSVIALQQDLEECLALSIRNHKHKSQSIKHLNKELPEDRRRKQRKQKAEINGGQSRNVMS